MNVSNYMKVNNSVQWSAISGIVNSPVSPFLSKIVLGTSIISLVALVAYRFKDAQHTTTTTPDFTNVKDKVKKAYAYVFGGCVLTTLAGTAAHISGFSLLLLKNPLLAGIPLLIGNIASVYKVATSSVNEGANQKIKWVVFNIFMGASLSTIGFVSKQLIVQAAAISLGIGGIATLISYLAPDETFLKWEGPLYNGLASLSLISLASLFFPQQAASIGLDRAIIYGGLALVTGLLMSSTQRLFKEAKENKGKFDPIKSSLAIYLDGLNIFVRILKILVENKQAEEEKEKEQVEHKFWCRYGGKQCSSASLNAFGSRLTQEATLEAEKIVSKDLSREELEQTLSSLSASTLSMLGKKYLEQGKYDYTITVVNKIFKDAKKVSNAMPWDIRNAANAKYFLGNVKEANALINLAIKAYFKNPLFLNQIPFQACSESLKYKVILGQWEEAKIIFDTIKNNYKNDITPIELFAGMLAEAFLGNFDAAKELCSKIFLKGISVFPVVDEIILKHLPKQELSQQQLYEQSKKEENDNIRPFVSDVLSKAKENDWALNLVIGFMYLKSGNPFKATGYVSNADKITKESKDENLLSISIFGLELVTNSLLSFS